MEARINIITLGVTDMGKARDFYEKGLGWPVSNASTDGILFFQLGGVVLALYPHSLLAEDAMVDTAEGLGFRGVTLAHNVLTKPEVVAILKQAEAAGGKIVKPAQAVFWGGYSGYFADPDGHLWEVAWNPFFAINECGELVLD